MRAAASSLIASALLVAGAACGDDDPSNRGLQRPAERIDGADQRKPARPAPSGRQLFVQNCGSCHTLADAGTTGAVGPDLDEHFGSAHPPHIGEIRDTIRKGPGSMPAALIEGRDARTVAKYVVSATRG